MPNDFFNATGNPSTSASGSSSTMRTEFSSVGAGFDKLPTLTANGSKLVRVNAGATALEAVAVGTAVDIGALTTAATTKATPVDADELPLADSAASYALKKLTWANLKTTLGSTFAALAGSVSQAFSAASIELGHATDTTVTRVSAGLIAVEGQNVALVGTASTFTAKQTFAGTSALIATALTNAVEPATISATAATGTIAYDVSTQSVLYYTSSAAANWTVNFRHSSGTALNTSMATGDILTVTFAVTQGGTAYYNSAVQVDGNSVTPKYGGGTAWSSGTASGIDSYTYTIIKTGSAAFTVLVDRRTFA